MSIYGKMSFLTRLRKRPFEHALGMILLYNGILKLVQGGPVISYLESELLAQVWLSLSFIAAIFILSGLQWRGSHIVGTSVERVGHYTSIVTLLGTAAYSFWFLELTPDVWYSLGDDFTFMAASSLRIWFLWEETIASAKAREKLVADRLEGS